MTIPIYTPRSDGPMNVAFFASGGPGNFAAAVDAARGAPDCLSIACLVTDRPGIPAIALAEANDIPAFVYDFEARCGRWSDVAGDPEREARYIRASAAFHDDVLAALREFEDVGGRAIDLLALAYRRILRGRILQHFAGRIINQHPADLTVRDGQGARKYIGIAGHARELRDGRGGSRTSTILVREGVDSGEILAQGPWVPFAGDAHDDEAVRAHETLQKRLSDWPALRCVLTAIARGRVAISSQPIFDDGMRGVFWDGRLMPYGGLSLDGAVTFASEAQS